MPIFSGSCSSRRRVTDRAAETSEPGQSCDDSRYFRVPSQATGQHGRRLLKPQFKSRSAESVPDGGGTLGVRRVAAFGVSRVEPRNNTRRAECGRR